MIPVPPEEKWLTDDENESKGVSMLSICRDFLKKGRKEGYDVVYMKGFMAAQCYDEFKIKIISMRKFLDNVFFISYNKNNKRRDAMAMLHQVDS